jgi:hypothetical protein
VHFTRIVYFGDDAREKIDKALTLFNMNGALITQVDVPMEEKGRPVKVRVITFANKPQMP